jgi:L-glyceraldehyde 3-phosphate reductase
MPQSDFDAMQYRQCGSSGLKLPVISLGCWFNFGDEAEDQTISDLIFGAFDLGITHMDLANIYGPPPGAAERRVGPLLKQLPRGDLVVSTKGGLTMRPGPYGKGGSRKNLIQSFDESLQRLGLDYVDLYYHHAPDAETRLEETLGALDSIVNSGKALYTGISNYDGATTRKVNELCDNAGLARPIANQVQYSLITKSVEEDLLPIVRDIGIGVVAYSPLARGLLAGKPVENLFGDRLEQHRDKVQPLKTTIEAVEKVAAGRGQTPSQTALAWTLRDPAITTALIGASRIDQVRENVAVLDSLELSGEELQILDDGYRLGAGTIKWR